MPNPQPTGWLFPQTPTPVRNRYPTIAPSNPSSASEIASATYHAFGGGRRSATLRDRLGHGREILPPVTSGARNRGSSVVLSASCLSRRC